ncbi:hypothetical protein C2G38_2207303 [Gigaspora rosea]|uniref:Uncharacterized protein n=1 Tax=Gigaspora rosea TaxID=44941 RepID=A0A397UKK3_9GLOM|nr:hypothetical protein C2G38_2207303 [Gigaspora rosea]
MIDILSSQILDASKILGPDDVWLTISQGVSEHINHNAEKFRNRFVKHEGQKELIIGVDGILGNWPEIVNRIVAAADNNVEKIDLRDLLEYWMKLQEKVANFRTLNLELDFWLDRLEPVIWNLVATYRGEVDEDFWGRIVRIDKVFGSGGNGIVGVPFTLDGEKLKFIAGFIGAIQEVLEDSDSEFHL